MGKKRRRRAFSDNFKAETVRLVRESGRSIGTIARELDLTETALRRWVRQAEVDAGRGPAEALTTSERDELTQHTPARLTDHPSLDACATPSGRNACMYHGGVLVAWPIRCVSTRCLVSLLLCAAFAACAPFVAPRTPNLLTTKGNHHAYSWDDFEKDRAAYDVGVRQGDKAGIATATYYRDRMLWSVVADVNWTYYRFRNEFHGLRSTGKTAADIAKLGMSAANTVLGGSAVLSGAVTALEGSQLSFEKNFLEEKTMEILLTTMDALREKRMADIQRKMVLPAPGYSFEEAYADALALFSAGTVPSALERISAEAGKQERDAQAERTNETQLRVIATLPETTAGAVELYDEALYCLMQPNRFFDISVILALHGWAPDAASRLMCDTFEDGQ